MLPIITVGLTPAGRAAVERIPGDRELRHFDTAEEALWAMGNEDATGETGTPAEPIRLDAAGTKWMTHVVYGDDAFGPLLAHTAMDPKPVEVPAAGLVMVVTDSLGDDQFAPRKVIDGTPESREITRQAVGAVKRLRALAFLAVDQLPSIPSWTTGIEYQLQQAEQHHPPAVLDATAAQDQAQQLKQLRAMVARGEHRPGLFEEQDRQRRGIR